MLDTANEDRFLREVNTAVTLYNCFCRIVDPDNDIGNDLFIRRDLNAL